MGSISVVEPPDAEHSQPAPVGFLFESGRVLRGPLPLRTIALGTVGSVLMLVGALGAGGVLIHDPVLGSTPLSILRYGHGKYFADAAVYVGFGLLVWAWVRLGRGVLASLVDARCVLLASTAWIAPLLISPPLFTRDVYSYLAQGLLALHGMDPYRIGPAVLYGPIADNVHWFWQSTPAPYGPLFIAVAKVVVLFFGDHLIASVVVMRLVLLSGLVMLVFALPGLIRHLGGNLAVALWLATASPITVVHLVGGPHNDMLMIGLLALGTLFMLDGKHVGGLALVSLAMAVKATAGLALPFLVWLWASRLEGSLWQRFTRALVPALAVFCAVFGACMAVAKVGFDWVPALSAPFALINYLSVPTGLGQAVHQVASLFVNVGRSGFVYTTRTIGTLVFAWIFVRQWWLARAGGAETVRRAAVVLFAGALLAPTTLPWYLTWGMALACALPWNRRALAVVVAGSVVLVLAFFPNGEQAMYHKSVVIVAVAAALIAAQALLQFDPLRLNRLLGRTEPVHTADPGNTCVFTPTPPRKADSASE